MQFCISSLFTAVFSSFQLYYHGDPIPIKVKVNNETSKVVKKVKISGKYFYNSYQ